MAHALLRAVTALLPSQRRLAPLLLTALCPPPYQPAFQYRALSRTRKPFTTSPQLYLLSPQRLARFAPPLPQPPVLQ